MSDMDASQLGRWTRFAAKGGIGKCTAIQDCVAEHEEDLMFMKDDEITVLMQIQGQVDLYLGYCEGVVGNFRGEAVRFHGRLKKPVLTKRLSNASPVSRPSSSQSAFTVSTRDLSSPAILSPSLVISGREVPSPTISITREPDFVPPGLAPSISSSSSISAVTFSHSHPPSPQPDGPAGEQSHPERSMSHESSFSSMPHTPADYQQDEATIASDAEQDQPLIPPIRLDQLEKQLSNDSPIEHPYPPDPTTFRFPPIDRASSVYSDDESNARMSIAMSDNGMGNIGLSLLQNFAGGGDDSDSDDDSQSIRRVQSPESTLDEIRTHSDAESPASVTLQLPDALEAPMTSRSEISDRSLSQYSESPPVSARHPPPSPPPLASDSPTRSPPPPLALNSPTHSTSEYDSDEDWEGADDIYDQYRYSRFSMASKMSRYSKGSMHTIGSSSDAPPMPNKRTSAGSTHSARERKGSKGKMPSRLMESTTVAEANTLRESSKMEKNRPAPLTFKQEPEPSPLLHATFGSPQASPTVPSAASRTTFGSPTLISPLYPSTTAAALNRKLTKGKDRTSGDEGSGSLGARWQGSGEEEHHDETMPMTAISQAAEFVHLARESPPPTPAIGVNVSRAPESSVSKEKRILAVSNADDNDGPPPPPYSPSASADSTPGPSMSQAPTSAVPEARPQARIRDPNRPAPHPLMRQSLFMPHPGAPKPAPSTAGPMYGRPQPAPDAPPPPPQHRGPPLGSIHQVLGMVAAARREGRPAPPTVYGRFEFDLSTSVGPVPITFSHEPQNNIPANRAVRPSMPWAPSRTASPASQLGVGLAGRRSLDPTGRRSATSPPIPPPEHFQQMLSAAGPAPGSSPSQLATDLAARRSTDPAVRRVTTSPPVPPPTQIQPMMTTESTPRPAVEPQPGLGLAMGQPLQRTNFTPTVHTSRPRSRSFSGLTDNDGIIRTEVLKEGSRDDTLTAQAPLSPPLSPTRPLQITTKRSKSAMATTATVTNLPAPQRATVSHSPTVLRGLHAPSPLSLSQNNTVVGGPHAVVAPPVRSPPLRASTNPLPASSPPADLVATIPQQASRALPVDDETSANSRPVSVTHSVNGVELGSSMAQMQSPLTTLPETLALSASPPSSPRSALNFPVSGSPKILRHSRSAMLPTTSISGSSPFSSRMSSSSRVRTASQGQAEPRQSVDTIRSDSSPSISSPTEDGSVMGLRVNKRSNSKPQMPPLRLVTTNQSSHQSIRSPTRSVTSEYTVEQDTVQVQDTDFELIKPTLPPHSPFRGSFESLPSPARPGLLRTDSPSFSDISGHSHPTLASASSSPKEDASQIEAHRQRELRWISAMSSMSPSQARKSKKIRKMVLDGVPASVRYQVWATLTDSKGKRMEGLYQRLAQREKVAAYPEIERDIQSSFSMHPQLQDGSLAKLLQAYLCLVPDTQYSRGLALVAAQLLLQSPEEDAFWTFVSLMDNHLRPYFSNNSIQLEIDASLFAKALENNDSASAKKVFVDMGINPGIVCRAWFMTVFADALPSDYVVRLWDVFLCEGVTFLFRAGLALFSCTRRLFLSSTSPEAILDILTRPPPTALPPSPSDFIELAFSIKFKDDDVRKQRGKLEAHVKRRTAHTRASPISTTPTISLPKSGV